MANRLPFSHAQWCEKVGVPYEGALMYTFFSGTGQDELKETFSDIAGTIPHENPIVADANGIFPAIYGNGAYKIRVYDKDRTEIVFEEDPVEGTPSSAVSPPEQEREHTGADLVNGILTLQDITAVPGQNTLDIYYSGSHLEFERDYLIISSTEIQFLGTVHEDETLDISTLETAPVGTVDASQVSYNGGTVQAQLDLGITPASFTDAQLNDIADAVNTTNKGQFKIVGNSSQGIPVYASGASAGSPWLALSDNSVINTPV